MILENSIIPMSDLRTKLDEVKRRLKKNPLVITNNGRPDFGICDLETLEIAIQVKELQDLLKRRLQQRDESEPVETVFSQLDKKYGSYYLQMHEKEINNEIMAYKKVPVKKGEFDLLMKAQK